MTYQWRGAHGFGTRAVKRQCVDRLEIILPKAKHMVHGPRLHITGRPHGPRHCLQIHRLPSRPHYRPLSHRKINNANQCEQIMEVKGPPRISRAGCPVLSCSASHGSCQHEGAVAHMHDDRVRVHSSSMRASDSHPPPHGALRHQRDAASAKHRMRKLTPHYSTTIYHCVATLAPGHGHAWSRHTRAHVLALTGHPAGLRSGHCCNVNRPAGGVRCYKRVHDTIVNATTVEASEHQYPLQNLSELPLGLRPRTTPTGTAKTNTINEQHYQQHYQRMR